MKSSDFPSHSIDSMQKRKPFLDSAVNWLYSREEGFMLHKLVFFHILLHEVHFLWHGIPRDGAEALLLFLMAFPKGNISQGHEQLS